MGWAGVGIKKTQRQISLGKKICKQMALWVRSNVCLFLYYDVDSLL